MGGRPVLGSFYEGACYVASILGPLIFENSHVKKVSIKESRRGESLERLYKGREIGGAGLYTNYVRLM